ncbi:integrin alpha-3 isoform X2 [Danio rerio]|uniref:Integrin alpha-3 isoform X2 n=5 Tax=Danio rerio TaxID=7955 RepID=A0A8M9QA60_DANRE|nr:integrin alpha-3 isoform X2 [Danio rerio]XP_021330225.1 integrin alpha-3 isoform X2 [Danio rerio]XP_696861.6 integrin alpha-3 isoform X2 [Danio rerio]|eukprot:XP_005164152.1 integrin alpha-3 isoform X2 [Danio rerio]
MIVFHRKGLRLTLVFVLSAARLCQAFNLDVSFAVVKEGKTAGSLFGLSVALHEQVVNEKRHMLLVGAPKEKAESGLSANETGDVYACPISADSKDCARLNLISSNPEDKPDLKNYVIDGMWLGVSIVSQSQPGGRVVACGHRYIRNFTSNFRMIGRCYVRGNDLQLNLSDYQWQSYDEICDPREAQNSEGMCLLGMSAAVTFSEIFFGAPGCFNWQGNIFSKWHNPADEFHLLKSKLPDSRKGNIYIGYSTIVDQDVLVKGKDTVVTGAPRDEAKGSVMMAEVLKSGGSGEVKIKVTVTGEQVGSYFGNSVAVVDLNNDGWKDLIVGAPFYFDRKMDKGGAVYVYMNQNGSFRNKSDVVLTGPKDSGFGMSVVAIGDVNQDGFQDFAVGAPYHSTGRVSIWTGSKTGISQEPSQVIDGKDIPGGGFQTFGYSISRGLDVDRNGYPDIAVGSLDDRVVLLRSRPVIHLKNTFTVTPMVINLEDCVACIEAKVCFSYTYSTGTASSQKAVTLQYTVEADQQSSRSPRVSFLDNNKGKYTGKMSVNPSGDCHSLKLELASKTIQDKVSAIIFQLSVSVVDPPPSGGKMLEDLSAFPVISQRDALTGRAEIHIQKACGLDNKCESNLQMTAAFTDEKNTPFLMQEDHQIFNYTTDIKKLKLLVNVSNVPSEGRKAEDAYNAILNITIPSSLSFSSLNPKLPSTLNGDPSSGGSYLLCTLGDPFKSNQRVEIEITFETSGISIDMQEIETELQLSTLSDQNDLRPLSRVLLVEYILQPLFNLIPYFRAEFSGNVVGESAMKSTSDIGSPVEFNISVDISGKPLGNLGFLEVVFQWPSAVANEKWLLYLSEIQMTGTSESFCVAKGIVNPLNLTVSERKSRRRKRDEVLSESKLAMSQKTRQGQNKPREVLNCTKGTARCQTFSCPLSAMKTSAMLTVRARVWNSTMLEDYRAKGVSVQGSVMLTLKTDKKNIKMNNNIREFTVEIDPAVAEELPYEAPLWIIIVSVLSGVVMLGVIVILLWKCGFFKRANTRELYEAKAQKAEMKTQPSENDRLTEED